MSDFKTQHVTPQPYGSDVTTDAKVSGTPTTGFSDAPASETHFGAPGEGISGSRKVIR